MTRDVLVLPAIDAVQLADGERLHAVERLHVDREPVAVTCGRGSTLLSGEKTGRPSGNQKRKHPHTLGLLH
ncbi:hypothetical protein MAR_031975 [Mya arenaria]|uniref:Uncharacterized protein n=1 Tax=Mya arenaria TaxID=6604 RepID=A0ABY7FDN6_MYAAR|nr:hypothetical protein MAR_031975 [Mya arenaria]